MSRRFGQSADPTGNGAATPAGDFYGSLAALSDAAATDVLSVLARARKEAPLKLVRLGFYGYALLSPRMPFVARVVAGILWYMEWQNLQVPDQASDTTIDVTPVQTPVVGS